MSDDDEPDDILVEADGALDATRFVGVVCKKDPEAGRLVWAMCARGRAVVARRLGLHARRAIPIASLFARNTIRTSLGSCPDRPAGDERA